VWRVCRRSKSRFASKYVEPVFFNYIILEFRYNLIIYIQRTDTLWVGLVSGFEHCH
jgi:hypothetical protein